jgi:hypothetical protein
MVVVLIGVGLLTDGFGLDTDLGRWELTELLEGKE